MTREEAIKILNASDYFWLRPTETEFDALNMAIDALEQIESGRYVEGECRMCSKEYGTLGCCTTVSNHWVYSCKEGMAQYAEALEQEPNENLISRKEAIDALMKSSVYAWTVEEDQIAREWALNIINKLPAKE